MRILRGGCPTRPMKLKVARMASKDGDQDNEGDDSSARGGSKGNNNDGSRSRSRTAVCACPFIIRVARKTLDDTTIRGESCGVPFRLA